jgi:hypothetical protein
VLDEVAKAVQVIALRSSELRHAITEAEEIERQALRAVNALKRLQPKAKLVLVLAVVLGSASCVAPTAPSEKVGPWICQTQERCSYSAPYYVRECRRDQYISQTPCPATPIP